MATKLSSLLLFLLLLGFQEMMIRPAEAAICQAPSTIFHGLCFSDKNCGSICEKEGFLFGECKRFKCICKKDCNLGGSVPGVQNPEQGPPSANEGGSTPGGGDPVQDQNPPGNVPSEGDGSNPAPDVEDPGQGSPIAGPPNKSPPGGKGQPQAERPVKGGSVPGSGSPGEGSHGAGPALRRPYRLLNTAA